MDELAFESENLLVKTGYSSLETLHNINLNELPKDGTTRQQLIKARVNQSFFRSSILASYNNTCCITGINNPEFLIAGHIKPWSIDEKNRLNPQNGIAINSLHDKAFETGLITITTDYKIKISPILHKQKKQNLLRIIF
ncbi:MAG: HNH endonuclease [Bacteroidota bacterium]